VDTDASDFCRALHPKLVGALALHCGDRPLAEELAQETLARVWERWATVRALDAPGAWAFRVGFNLAASRFRRQAAERRAHRRLGLPSTVAPAVDTAEILAVRAAVAALPDRQRAAVVLRYFADLPVAQVAEILGCESGTVKSLTSHARAQLRRQLQLDIDDNDEEEREYA
jgi:RNA polymerase sigma-70 factor (ECF subfamily)